MWGYSGGGPYAVACAPVLGDRVTATAVAAGMGQVGVWAEPADFAKTDRQMLDLCVKHPGVARLLLGTHRPARQASARSSALKSFLKQLGPTDRAVVEDQDQTRPRP